MIVNFTHDSTEAIEAVLWTTRGPWYTFRDATALKASSAGGFDHPPTPMLGDILIHKHKISYFQVLP